jgi:hypothetical protein
MIVKVWKSPDGRRTAVLPLLTDLSEWGTSSWAWWDLRWFLHRFLPLGASISLIRRTSLSIMNCTSIRIHCIGQCRDSLQLCHYALLLETPTSREASWVSTWRALESELFKKLWTFFDDFRENHYTVPWIIPNPWMIPIRNFLNRQSHHSSLNVDRHPPIRGLGLFRVL